MDIVKAFNTTDLHTEIVIKCTINDPLFRASDIAEILELNNIRSSITGFDDSEKVVRKSSTLGGIRTMRRSVEKGIWTRASKTDVGIHQCNLQNEIVREFECKYDCIKTLLMSDKTLTKALANGVQYNGHIFKEAGSKMHIGGRGTEVPPNPLLCLEES